MSDGGLHQAPGRRDPAASPRRAAANGVPRRDPGGAGRGGSRGDVRRRRTVLIVAAAAALVLAAVGGYLLGPFGPGADPDATPAPVEAAVDPAGAAGTIHAGQLAPGQCFAAFESAWQGSFELADCAQPHAAQLVAAVPADAALGADGFPGEERLRAEAMRTCQSPEAMDVAVAGTIDDLVVDASYPRTQAEWDGGDRSYRCFAARESGEPLVESLLPV